MAKIVPKLNLNKTPQQVENNSLIYAKNIKLLKDNSIGPDGKIENIINLTGAEIVGHIVGNNKVYLLPSTGGTIYIYDELEPDENKRLSYKETNWTWNRGKITGCVTTNNTGETILTICESDATKLIPIKHINLSHEKPGHESLYTQNPVIPIVNLKLANTYAKTIPNGVYQFFVRFKIRDSYYTGWLPCSKECFAGNHNETKTIQGKLRYTNIHTDAHSSFVFDVSKLTNDYDSYYEAFQLGFILSHDDSTVARLWKEFPLDTTIIYFDYDSIEEYNIDDLLKVNYELFDVKNVDFFRNKLYISNYKETDFNSNDGFGTVTLVSKEIEKGKYIFNKQNLVISSDNLYYTNYGSESFSDLAINTTDNKNSISEITSESSSKITTSNGGACKLKCGCDYDTDPDIYWIYNIAPSNTDSSTNIEHIFPRFGAWNIDLDKGPFGDTSSGIIEAQIGTIWTSFWFVKSKNSFSLPHHPFAGPITDEIKWYDGHRHKDERQMITEEGLLKGWRTLLDDGFTEEDIDKYLSSFVRSINSYFETNERYLVTKIKAIYGNKEVILFSEGNNTEASNYAGDIYTSTEDISIKLKTYLNNIVGVSVDSPEFYYINVTDINGVNYSGPVSAFIVEYSKITFKATGSSDVINIDSTKNNYSKTLIVNPNADYLENTYVQEQYNTLLPFTKYKFYLHYVKNNGIITNGKYISESEYTYGSEISGGKDIFRLIYPKFTNIKTTNIPSDYIGWFISCTKTENEVCKCFDYFYKDGRHYVSCIEEDAMLCKLVDNITIIASSGSIEQITTKAKYYSSGSTQPLTMFGGIGYVSWLDSDVDSSLLIGDLSDHIKGGMTLWIKNISKANSNKLNQLIKITPIININQNYFDEYNNLNLPGYAGIVYKLNKDIAPNIYVAGTDIYNKVATGNNISLDENTNYISIVSSSINYIQSNFNINYLALTEEINPRIRTIKSESGNYKNIVTSVNSLTSSDIYELPSMYKDYTRKYFTPVETHTLTEFNNTVRSSDVNTDEIYRNIFRFEATDYYNIPCNKGIIINMFSIANNIYVHTQHSLYKFSGNTSLTAKDGDVTTKETDAFDTGISEVFDSDNGFGGLSKKEHSLVTYNAYVFYDEAAKNIYAYGGEGQMTSISREIDKIINLGIDDICFAEDYYNDRFFANIKIGQSFVCLSYNFVAKSFVSIHDFSFTEGFSSRSKVYFLGTDKSKLYSLFNNVSTNYGDLHNESLISYNEYTTNESCIDVIFNEEYEKIKSLNYINWICSEIQNYITSVFMAEENITKYSGTKLLIYSDQCNTEVVNLTDDSGNALDATSASINDVNSYKYPRYNCGIWSLNYFRDVRNANDTFKYGTGVDDKSLIYGKYFVVRFIFRNKNFKFENIHFNVNDYGKTKY